MKPRIAAITIVVLGTLLCAPGAALALEQGGEALVGRSVTTVSGADMAQDMVDRVSGVELGSQATTVTLKVDGRDQAVSIGYSEILGEAGVDGESSLLPLAFIGAGVGGLLKFLSILTRLGR